LFIGVAEGEYQVKSEEIEKKHRLLNGMSEKARSGRVAALRFESGSEVDKSGG
jgi:hypothetical protein